MKVNHNTKTITANAWELCLRTAIQFKAHRALKRLLIFVNKVD